MHYPSQTNSVIFYLQQRVNSGSTELIHSKFTLKRRK